LANSLVDDGQYGYITNFLFQKTLVMNPENRPENRENQFCFGAAVAEGRRKEMDRRSR
jgi:hypothetical protein